MAPANKNDRKFRSSYNWYFIVYIKLMDCVYQHLVWSRLCASLWGHSFSVFWFPSSFPLIFPLFVPFPVFHSLNPSSHLLLTAFSNVHLLQYFRSVDFFPLSSNLIKEILNGSDWNVELFWLKWIFSSIVLENWSVLCDSLISSVG